MVNAEVQFVVLPCRLCKMVPDAAVVCCQTCQSDIVEAHCIRDSTWLCTPYLSIQEQTPCATCPEPCFVKIDQFDTPNVMQISCRYPARFQLTTFASPHGSSSNPSRVCQGHKSCPSIARGWAVDRTAVKLYDPQLGFVVDSETVPIL